MTLEQILEEVRTLTPEEQRQVRAALENEGSATNGRATTDEELRRRENAFVERLKANQKDIDPSGGHPLFA